MTLTQANYTTSIGYIYDFNPGKLYHKNKLIDDFDPSNQ